MIYNPDNDTVTLSRKEYNLLEDRIRKMRIGFRSILTKREHANGNYFFEWVVDAANTALVVDGELEQHGKETP